MADRFWINSSASIQNFNDTTYWSTSSGGGGGASVPVSGDNSIFDGNGLDDCQLNVAIDVDTFQITTAYSGFIDAGTDDLNHTVKLLDLEDTAGATMDFGTGTWTIQGPGTCNLDNTESLLSTNRPKVVSGGDFTVDIDLFDVGFESLVVSAGDTVTTAGSGLIVQSDITVAATGVLTINPANGVFVAGGAVNSVINIAGTVNGTTPTIADNANGSSNTIDITVDGTIGSIILAGQAMTVTLGGIGSITTLFNYRHSGGGSGAMTFDAVVPTILKLDLEADNTTMVVGNSTNNPSFTITGDVVTGVGTGTLTWTKGTGTITFSGTSNQTVDFDGVAVEDITIDKTAGKVTLTNSVSTDSVTCTDGELDIDGNNLTTVSSGNFTVAANFTLSDTTGGGLITVAGNLDINGTSGNTVTWNGPDLDVTGTADADFTVVTNSDALAGTEVDATDNCTDSGGNTNWDFGAAGTILPQITTAYNRLNA